MKTVRRNIAEWWDDYKPANKHIVRAQLETRSWDEIAELCVLIHEADPSLRYNYNLVCDYNYQKLISPDEWDRIKQSYINQAEALDWDYELPNDLPPLSEVKVWELYLTKYCLMDMAVMINELTDSLNDDHLKAMWELYTGPMYDYLDVDKLTAEIGDSILRHLGATE